MFEQVKHCIDLELNPSYKPYDLCNLGIFSQILSFSFLLYFSNKNINVYIKGNIYILKFFSFVLCCCLYNLKRKYIEVI